MTYKKKVCTYFHIIQYLKRSYLQKKKSIHRDAASCWFRVQCLAVGSQVYFKALLLYHIGKETNKQKTVMFLS